MQQIWKLYLNQINGHVVNKPCNKEKKKLEARKGCNHVIIYNISIHHIGFISTPPHPEKKAHNLPLPLHKLKRRGYCIERLFSSTIKMSSRGFRVSRSHSFLPLIHTPQTTLRKIKVGRCRHPDTSDGERNFAFQLQGIQREPFASLKSPAIKYFLKDPALKYIFFLT